MTTYGCQICDFSSTSPAGISSHGRKHRNEFESIVGRQPDDYDEVVALLRDGDTPEDYDGETGVPTTLEEYADD
ncbi:hypothetical protein [Halorubrum tebenquichense]|uniref:C2H2-type domain-containing protein n=1 Tax=Halorubrum tebenquichense DSM 14210 TaxID=1227485 RepID=M0DKK8_9EURY|nr:hypothetical protein [Halorubrum tebenquichense]ELZ35358.1 hypothetical protein C472_12510 [Halorubrum tebenquichense DSM 14210]